MRKRIITILLAAGATIGVASAQTMYDALGFSENEYFGTARSAGMGNAMTAVGGDIGGISINPAGSAVTGYSTFTISPGISLSSSESQFTTGMTSSSILRCTQGKFIMPNCGFILNFDNGSFSGVSSWTFGFCVNTSSYYNSGIKGRGINGDTCLSGYFANAAEGYTTDRLSDYNGPYDVSLAYNAYAIDPIDKTDHGCTTYIGMEENRVGNVLKLGGPISQRFNEETLGNKSDMLINMGFNMADVLYLGANLGISLVSKTTNYSTHEEAIDESLFQTGFKTLDYGYNYIADGAGVFGKFGAILSPGAGLRFGFTLQTPTLLSMKERYRHTLSNTSYSGGRSYINGPKQSPEGEFRYSITSPMRLGAGVAYTFGQFGVISVDYERANYKYMKLRDYSNRYSSYFDVENDNINEFMGASNIVRVGLEVKPTSLIAVRAGYNFNGYPVYEYNERNQLERIKADTQSISLGFGYESTGSFFFDLTGRVTLRNSENTLLYQPYLSDADVPVLYSKRNLITFISTLGWRF